jgi:hypothetical protein
MDQTRVQVLSDWKGVADAEAGTDSAITKIGSGRVADLPMKVQIEPPRPR